MLNKIIILLLIIAAFFIGIGSTISYQNAVAGEDISFSTLQFVGFFLSVFVSGASIVLAIAAINLARASEQAMIQRSDESIRLQNEVFQKTTDALQRIESSTGVTEKRLEDIIGGRVGDISERLAETAIGSSGKAQTLDELQEKIKESLLEELKPHSVSRTVSTARRRANLEKRRQKYKKFQESALTAFANISSITTLKVGDGSYTADGIDLFDGVFRKGSHVIGVSTFSDFISPESAPRDFLFSVADALRDNIVEHVYFLLDADDPSTIESIRKHISTCLDPLKESPADKISVIASDQSNVAEIVGKLKIGSSKESKEVDE